jgi:hypothetical protein
MISTPGVRPTPGVIDTDWDVDEEYTERPRKRDRKKRFMWNPRRNKWTGDNNVCLEVSRE